MSFTDYLENKILDHIFTDAAYSPPATLYLGLSTTTPTDAGGNFTEPAGGSYARKSVAAADMDAAASGSKDNGSALSFVTATASWGLVTHMGLFDASSAGNQMANGALSASKTIDNGDTAQFAAAALAFTLD